MKVALIVANMRHLKTEQVALGLRARGYSDITIVTVPFVARKPRTPIFNHRPDQNEGADLDDLAVTLKIRCIHLNSIEEFDTTNIDICLMTGGVLLPSSFLDIAGLRVLNCHAGLIPESRGLDAFKWSILEGNPVGNTLHFIDGEVDLGHVIHQERTPVFASDSLSSFARRHYEYEIQILTDFETYLKNNPIGAEKLQCVGPRHMRMKVKTESDLPAAFEVYKARFAHQRS